MLILKIAFWGISADLGDFIFFIYVVAHQKLSAFSSLLALPFQHKLVHERRRARCLGEWSLCAFFRRRHDFTAVLPSVWCIVSGERGFVYFYGFSGVDDSHNFNISIASVFRKTSLLVQTQRASKRFTTIAFKFSRSFRCIKFLEMTLFLWP